MRRPFFTLSTFTLAAGICVCGLLLNSNQVFAYFGEQPTDQQQSANHSKPKNTWSIGIYAGPSPFQLSAPANVSNPVLTPADVTDLDATVLAHPFMMATDSMHYLFCTVKDKNTGQGGIGLAESKNGTDWKYRQLVVDEPFDLSYPCVLKWQDDYYMIPEAHSEASVRLYRATDFPVKWTYEKDLLTGDTFISPSVFRHNDMWWMFVARPGNETLRLYYASVLTGPWTEHPQSPIVEKDKRIARPGGRPMVIDGKLYRFAQNCYPLYGKQVRAFEVTNISTTSYAERMVDKPIVTASGIGWNADHMHHVGLHLRTGGQWLAAADGKED